MRSFLLLFGILFQIVFHSLKAQSPNYEKAANYTKGRIEWLIEDTIRKNLPVITYLFNESEKTLHELERNLIYKTNNRIYFQACFDYPSYSRLFEKYRYLHQGSPLSTNAPLTGHVYEPILITGNTIDARYQIRKAIARQFLNEFLFGFQFYEKFDPVNQNAIPLWLKEGFIQYFAEGLNQGELLLFVQKNQDGSFRNLNFIDKQDEILFGKVLWYLFELEKGSNSNSVFWSLLKYVQSFEVSFEYQYGLKFKDWLKLQLAQLQHSQATGNSGEIQIQNTYHDFQSKHIDIDWNSGNYIHELHAENQIKYVLGNTAHPTQKTIWEHTFLHPSLYPGFRMSSFKFDRKHPETWYGVIWNNGWFIVNSQSNVYTPLPSSALYTLIEASDQLLYVLREHEGKTSLIKIRGHNGSIIESTLLNPNGSKIAEIKVLDSTDYWFLRLLQQKERFYNQLFYQKDKRQELIYQTEIKAPSDNFNHMVITDSNEFSLIKNNPIENAVFHFKRPCIEDTFLIQKTKVKGLFYQQYEWKNDSFVEVYAYNNAYQINILSKNEPIFDRDTFVKREIFNSRIDSQTLEKKIYYPSNKLFIAPFPKPEITVPRQIPLVNKRKDLPWKPSKFKDWFLIHRYKFHLDNKEISALYDGSVSPVDQYNSLLTFYLENTITDAAAKHRIDFLLFSNTNRRRIGLEVNHRFIKNKLWQFETDIAYRLRQFVNQKLENLRNRSFLVSMEAARHIHFNARILSGIQFHHSQIIPLNNDPERVSNPIQSQSLCNIPINYEYFTNYGKDGRLFLIGGFNAGLMYAKNGNHLMSDINLNIKADHRFSIFKWKSTLSSRYSLSNNNITYIMGGTQGWISSLANTDAQYNETSTHQIHFLKGGLPIRGIHFGQRIGNSYVYHSQDIGFPLLRLFPNSLKETLFWKSIHVYGFFDAGMAFFNESPYHFDNPYNRVTINNPNYILVATTRGNPWIVGYGYGMQFSILGYPLKLEYAYGYEGHTKTSPRLLLSLGKNF